MNFFKKHKLLFNIAFFAIVTGFTIYTVFFANDVNAMLNGLKQVSVNWLLLAAILSAMFIILESVVLSLLIKSKKEKLPLLKCIKYSLTGYFYSGITPSASGGQPMQLLAMSKDGYSASKSTATLIVMAFYYKLIMVIIGALLLIFWHMPIINYFGNYVWVYYLGFVLNLAVLFAILSFMFIPKQIKHLARCSETLLIKIKILKVSETREIKINNFIGSYSSAVTYMFNNKLKISLLVVTTLLQRLTLMIIPVFIYLGLPLQQTNVMNIFLITAATYVAVDMLPLPGSQGISELIFLQSLSLIFTANYVGTAMVLTRCISFYVLLLSGMVTVVLSNFVFKKTQKTIKNWAV